MPTATEKGEFKREPIPEGTQQAVCYAVVDLGTQPPSPYSQFKSEPTRKVMLCFEFPEERMSGTDRNGVEFDRPKACSVEFTLSLGKKANLRKFLAAWRGKQFTEEELKGFELNVLAGMSAFVTIMHNDKGYEKIASAVKLPKGMVPRMPENELVRYDIDQPVPQSLPEWIRKKIANSVEHQAAAGKTHASGAEPPPPEDGDPGPAFEDDDIPF